MSIVLGRNAGGGEVRGSRGAAATATDLIITRFAAGSACQDGVRTVVIVVVFVDNGDVRSGIRFSSFSLAVRLFSLKFWSIHLYLHASSST